MLPQAPQVAPVMPMHPRTVPGSRRLSLPTDFFARQSSRDKSRDEVFSAQRLRLQQALLMPAQHRWIADWIFVDADDAFHRNIPVPPEAFRNSLAVRINHQFTEIDAATFSPHPPQSAAGTTCPVSGMTIAQSPNHRSLKVTDVDLLLLPVACLDGITVGYAFGGSSYVSPGGLTTGGPAFCGRFAFNSPDDDLLMVIGGVLPGTPSPWWNEVTVIMSVAKLPGKETREHTFITCPKMEYGFEHLPSQILSVASAKGTPPEQAKHAPQFDDLEELFAVRDLDSLSSTELLGGPVRQVPSTPRLLDAFPNGADGSFLRNDGSNDEAPVQSEDTLESDNDVGNMDFVQSLLAEMKTPNASPVSSALTRATPWESDSYGATSDGVGIPRMPGCSPTSSGAFDLRALAGALGGIAASMHGTFKTTKATPSTVDPVTGRSVAGSFLNIVATLERADKTVSAMLQRQAAGLYFAAATAIRGDEGRLKAGAATTMCPLVYGARAGTAGTSAAGGETRMREERREAKKRRNRMSAARSNQRRKEALELRKKAVADLRARAKELREREERLIAENERLKERVYLAGVLDRAVACPCPSN